MSDGSSTRAEAVVCRCPPEYPVGRRFGGYHIYHRRCRHCGGVVPLGGFIKLLLDTERRSTVPESPVSV